MRRTRRGALAAGAAAAGGVVLGAHGGRGTSAAAPSASQDQEILGGLVQLEDVQVGFYEAAVAGSTIEDPLLSYARTVGAQEVEHAAFLRERLGGRGPRTALGSFTDAVASTAAFGTAAVELEEAVVAAYIGQGANLTDGLMAHVATLISVEARQASWLRDLVGELPAPRSADPARPIGEVLDELRAKGWLA